MWGLVYFSEAYPMKKILLGLAVAALVLSGCAGSQSKDPEKVNDALVAFTSCVQGSRWQEALNYVTEDEANEISEDGYEFKEEYQQAARRLPLSTLKQADLAVDGDGRLVGIKDVMDEANKRYVVSEEQSKIGTKEHMQQMEEDHIRRRLEEGQKVMQEEEEAKNKEQEVEVFSNKLTDEEKRKYGSTRDLQAPEHFQDENTQAAEEEIHEDYGD